MRQINNLVLSTKINRFIARKSQQHNLKDPLESLQVRGHSISRDEITKSYLYTPTKAQRVFTY